MQEFNIGQTLAISPITLYAMGFVIGPILTSAFSEEFGRQYIYKISLLLHLIFTTIGGSAANFRTLAVARAMAGILGSPCVSIFAGVLNDIWEPDDKIATLLFALYGLGGITATSIGPISGEAIVTDRGWRWSFWLIAILVGICFLSMLFVPETYFPEIKRQVLKVPRKSLKNTFKVALTRPLHMLFVEPVILPTAAIVTVGQIVIFVFYASYPVVLQNTYGFSDYSIGLAFLPLLVGNIFSLPVLAVLEKRRAKLPVRVPEQMLVAGMIAGILMPVGLFWYIFRSFLVLVTVLMFEKVGLDSTPQCPLDCSPSSWSTLWFGLCTLPGN
jgi:MFS family permease